jgi:hypothetical protein
MFFLKVADPHEHKAHLGRLLSHGRDIRGVARETASFCNRRAPTLSAALAHFGAGALIVTLLALLEMSRLGAVRLTQAEEWGDVGIEAG